MEDTDKKSADEQIRPMMIIQKEETIHDQRSIGCFILLFCNRTFYVRQPNLQIRLYMIHVQMKRLHEMLKRKAPWQ